MNLKSHVRFFKPCLMKRMAYHVLILAAIQYAGVTARLHGKPHKSSGLCDADMAAVRMRTPPTPFTYVANHVANTAATMANVSAHFHANSTSPQLVEIGDYIKVTPGHQALNASNITNVSKPQPRAPPTYKYVGCYGVGNPEMQFVRPGPAGTATALPHMEEMTVKKCFDWCHRQRSRGWQSTQFFVLKAGKECSCLPYLWKSRDIYPCDLPCIGQDGNLCGGLMSYSVYVMVECPGLLPVHRPMSLAHE